MSIIKKLAFFIIVFLLSRQLTDLWMYSDIPQMPRFIHDWFMNSGYIESQDDYGFFIGVITFINSFILLSIVGYLGIRLYRKLRR